jgi:uncharacterized membrane protein YhaH (DUF805 family)
VRSGSLNIRQRIVVVIGFGVAVYFLGSWFTTRGEGAGRSGWVAFAPLSGSVDTADLPGPGLHPWVRLLIWFTLIAAWGVVGVILLRSRNEENSYGPAD